MLRFLVVLAVATAGVGASAALADSSTATQPGSILSATVGSVDPGTQTASVTFLDDSGDQQTATLDLTAATIRIISPDGTTWTPGSAASLVAGDDLTVYVNGGWDAVDAAVTAGTSISVAEVDDDGQPACPVVGGGPVVSGSAGASTSTGGSTVTPVPSSTVAAPPLPVDPPVCLVFSGASGAVRAPIAARQGSRHRHGAPHHHRRARRHRRHERDRVSRRAAG